MNAPAGDDRAMPGAARHLAAFAPVLRRFGFAAAPEQTAVFLEAVGLLGPRSIEDVRRAAHATFAPAPERRAQFDTLFRAWFHGEMLAAQGVSDEEDEVPIRDQGGGAFEPPDAPELDESGQAATVAEALASRRFERPREAWALHRFARAARGALPRRRGYRRAPARSGAIPDLRRALRSAVRHGGEVPTLPWLERRTRQRRVLVLLDVSGSMKRETEATLRFAHALHHACERMECFTFGTRLTRITRALRLRNREQALARAAGLVADWDGGTRIGDALLAFLSVPRFAGYARGAVAIVVSDGLERGEHATMVDAVTRLARLAWRLSWLTPLATDPHFTPRTAALAAIAPLLDDLTDGGSTGALCAHVLTLDAPRLATFDPHARGGVLQ